MLRADTSILINRPVEEVWDFVVNHENVPNWALGFKEVRYTTEGPLKLGTKCEWFQSFLGKEINSVQEVTEYEPYKFLTFKSISGQFETKYRYIFEPTADGTKLSVFLEGEPGGFFKLAEPVLAAAVKRQLQHSFENLKDLVEAEALVPA